MAQWPPEALAAVETLIELILFLCEQVEARDNIGLLEEEVRGLQRTLNTNSGNSNMSPSQDPFGLKSKKQADEVQEGGDSGEAGTTQEPEKNSAGGPKGNRQSVLKTRTYGRSGRVLLWLYKVYGSADSQTKCNRTTALVRLWVGGVKVNVEYRNLAKPDEDMPRKHFDAPGPQSTIESGCGQHMHA